MDEMSYEILIRRAHHCGRSVSKGADADIYRKMEDAFNMLTAKDWSVPQDRREAEYQKAVKEIAGYISLAITKAIKEIKITEKISRLEELKAKLSMQVNKEIIDEVIDDVLDIFIEQNLEMR